ncbi:MAG TPA: UvrD-helicase domain-containing protein [Chloroflexota bacterium]|nr:UvrD-helicase domain-containing protein [Chloroflexota bacterium]
MNRSLLDDLNPEQREAVETVAGPVLILAGAGSGKTRVLTYRIAHLIRDYGVNPGSILAVTFTNKAAHEMKERVEQLVGEVPYSMSIGTFHSMAARLLRRDIDKLGWDRAFTIADDSQQHTLVRAICREQDIDEQRIAPAAILARISHAKNELVEPGELADRASSYLEKIAAQVYQTYQERLRLNNSLDFDDLLTFPVRLFRESPDTLRHYQERWRYLLVDEYQDTNHVQYLFTKLLAREHHNICVVGDDDQSIYSWRGADIRNILEFSKDYPETKVIKLEQNYRSTQTILDVAHSVVSQNYARTDKQLWTSNGKGALVAVHRMPTDIEEANFVAREIRRLVGRGQARARDCAVLYRTNAQSRLVERAMSEAALKYQVVAGLKFYDRAEVKDVLAYLRLIANPADDASLRRVVNVPARGLGDKSLELLQAYATSRTATLWQALEHIEEVHGLTARAAASFGAFRETVQGLREASQQLPLTALLEAVLDETGYRAQLNGDDSLQGQDRAENVAELERHAAQTAVDPSQPPRDQLARFLDEVTLSSDQDGLVDDGDQVTLITMHAAKGLEFPIVFIVGMTEGLFPHRRAEDDPAQMEEERRLCYVAMTRAKLQLYLVHAETRAQWGMPAEPGADRTRWRMIDTHPSRFLATIPPGLLHLFGAERGAAPPNQRTRDYGAAARWSGGSYWAQGELLRPGGHNQTGARHHWEVQSGSVAPVASAAAAGTKAFHAGLKVNHAKFGQGVVVRSDLENGDENVTVAFEGHGVKKLAAAFAHLERLG